MKKNVMLAALMLVSTLIFAQGKSHHTKKGHERHAEYLKKSLLLTEDQYSKVKSIHENFKQQFAAIRQDTAMTQGTARTKTRKLQEDQKAQMRTVLNEPQWAKWTEIQSRRKARKPASDYRRGRARYQERG